MKNWERLEKEVRDRLYQFIEKYGEVTNYTYPRMQGGAQCHTADRKEGFKEKKGANNQYYRPYTVNSLFKYLKPFALSTEHAILVKEINN